MPNNPRQNTKRHLEQAINAIDNALSHLQQAEKPYVPGLHDYKPEGYPEFTEPIAMVASSLLMAQDVIKDIKLKV